MERCLGFAMKMRQQVDSVERQSVIDLLPVQRRRRLFRFQPQIQLAAAKIDLSFAGVLNFGGLHFRMDRVLNEATLPLGQDDPSVPKDRQVVRNLDNVF